jgi:hypothetical protein
MRRVVSPRLHRVRAAASLTIAALRIVVEQRHRSILVRIG